MKRPATAPCPRCGKPHVLRAGMDTSTGKMTGRYVICDRDKTTHGIWPTKGKAQ